MSPPAPRHDQKASHGRPARIGYVFGAFVWPLIVIAGLTVADRGHVLPIPASLGGLVMVLTIAGGMFCVSRLSDSPDRFNYAYAYFVVILAAFFVGLYVMGNILYGF